MYRQYINSVWSRNWNLVNHLSNNYDLVDPKVIFCLNMACNFCLNIHSDFHINLVLVFSDRQTIFNRRTTFDRV